MISWSARLTPGNGCMWLHIVLRISHLADFLNFLKHFQSTISRSAASILSYRCRLESCHFFVLFTTIEANLKMVTAPAQSNSRPKSNTVVTATVLALVMCTIVCIATYVHRKYCRLISLDLETRIGRSSTNRPKVGGISKYHVDSIPLVRYSSVAQKRILKYNHNDNGKMRHSTMVGWPTNSVTTSLFEKGTPLVEVSKLIHWQHHRWMSGLHRDVYIKWQSSVSSMQSHLPSRLYRSVAVGNLRNLPCLVNRPSQTTFNVSMLIIASFLNKVVWI